MYLRSVSNTGSVYTHGLDECAVVISHETETNDALLPVAQIKRWTITGRLIADTEAALTTAIAALEAQYTYNLQDVAIVSNDGSTYTAHRISASNTFGGIVCKGVNYPIGTGAEYTTYRSYEIVLEARVGGLVLVGGQQALYSYQESLSFRGTGGARYSILETRNGPPQVQIVSEFTPVYATQVGSAIGYSGQIPAPPPIWGDYEDQPARVITYVSPQATGSGSSLSQLKYETSWNYSFMAPGAFNGQPGVGFR